MPGERPRILLETEALVIGYAMSRLDAVYLAMRGLQRWTQAFEEAGKALSVPASTFKNLRDEFDPFHSNARTGWNNRPLRPNRQHVMEDMTHLSDDAVMAMVTQILQQENASVQEAITSFAMPNRGGANVAERLLTGYRAEDYFLSNCQHLIQVPADDILDMRVSAQGYDFGVQGRPEWAIEIKGLKLLQGQVQFTDREWVEAKRRRENYWLIVVGNLAADPVPKIVSNPYENSRNRLHDSNDGCRRLAFLNLSAGLKQTQLKS